jgi:hypothetical protein
VPAIRPGCRAASLAELGKNLGGMDTKLIATFEARALSKLRHPSTARRLMAQVEAP